MRNIIYVIVLFVCCTLNAQTVSKKCKTCGKTIALCQYRGKHPSTPSSQSNNTISNNSQKRLVPSKAIDLGLTSGTKWAEWNIGSSSPEDCGYYYAWGETNVKTKYTKFNHKHPKGGSDKNGIINLNKQNDIATIMWGDGWSIPSSDQIYELTRECSWKKSSRNGHKGYIVTGRNGNSIFIPCAGYYERTKRIGLGGYGLYWSSQGGEECCSSDDSGWAYVMDIQGDYAGSYASGFCWLGAPIRPINTK